MSNPLAGGGDDWNVSSDVVLYFTVEKEGERRPTSFRIPYENLAAMLPELEQQWRRSFEFMAGNFTEGNAA